MNEPLRVLAYCVGGVSLVAGSFVTVSALTGTPMHQMKAVGAMFPAEIEGEIIAADGPAATPDLEDELRSDSRSARLLIESATTPLAAFQLQDPFSAEELRELERTLLTKLDEVGRRLDEIEATERRLADDQQHVDDLYRQLVELRTNLLEQEVENQARGDELERERHALEERRLTTYAEMATLFEDTKPKDAARLLTNVYAPEEAARILVQLDDDRVRELIGAIQDQLPDEAGAYVRALQALRANQE